MFHFCHLLCKIEPQKEGQGLSVLITEANYSFFQNIFYILNCKAELPRSLQNYAGKKRTNNCLLFRYIRQHAALFSCIIGKCTIYGGKGHIGFPIFPISGRE